jgi:hypothetical protein
MVAMRGAQRLTNSTDPRFVRLCGEQSDILLNKAVNKRLKVCGSFEREVIKGRKPLMTRGYKSHFNWAEARIYSLKLLHKVDDTPRLLDK